MVEICDRPVFDNKVPLSSHFPELSENTPADFISLMDSFELDEMNLCIIKIFRRNQFLFVLIDEIKFYWSRDFDQKTHRHRQTVTPSDLIRDQNPEVSIPGVFLLSERYEVICVAIKASTKHLIHIYHFHLEQSIDFLFITLVKRV